MKKLILLAGVLAIGGAFAECAYIKPITPTTTDPAWAYKWKFTGKTTKAVDTTCSSKGYVTRTAAALKIQGWSLYCDPNCGDFEAAEADEFFWRTKPSKAILGGGVTFEVANQIGKKGKNYEAAGLAVFTDKDGVTMYYLTFAGLGKYDTKKARVKSVSGNFAGIAAAPTSNGTDCVDGEKSKVWECCGCPTLDADSVAYGKWSVKYNKSIAKKYANGKLEAKHIYPKWAR